MGYTHYFSTVSTSKKNAAQLERAYKTAIKHCQTICLQYSKQYGGLSGYSAHAPVGKYGGINVNGSRENGHETFVLREHWAENNREFCKTAQKPYDIVVTACLIVLKHYMRDALSVGSDGYSQDWLAGLALATEVTGLKQLVVPLTIESRISERVKLRLVGG